MDIQDELFEIKPDGRVQELTSFIYARMSLEDRWMPTARELVEIGERYGVVGRMPLTVFERAMSRYCEDDSFDEFDDCDDFDFVRKEKNLSFYKNILANKR